MKNRRKERRVNRKVFIDWQKCLLDLRRHYAITKIAVDVSASYRPLKEICEGVTYEPRFTVGLSLLKMHRELYPEHHHLLFSSTSSEDKKQIELARGQE